MTLLEVLISTALTLALSGTILSLVAAGNALARAQPERGDLQPRARIARQVLAADLRDAGAGMDRPPLAGPLDAWFPAVVPSADGGITIWRTTGGAAQGTLALAAAAQATQLTIADSAGCPAGAGACGFSVGDTVVAFGTSGCRAALRVASVAGSALQLEGPPGCALDAGSGVAEGVVRTYRVDPVAAQLLRRDEATGSTVPLLDGVASLAVALFADAAGNDVVAGTSDGDLLRVRRVRLTLRLVAPNPQAGLSDLELVVDAVPRNLQGG